MRTKKVAARLLGIVFLCVLLAYAITGAYAAGGGPPSAANSSLVANPTSVPADGTTTSTLTVTLKDSFNTPLSGDQVSISAPTDSTAVFNPTIATLDVNGSANITITSTQAGTDSLNVFDITRNTTLTALGQVTFTPYSGGATNNTTSNTSSGGGGGSNGGPSCTDTPPSSAPNLFAVYNTRTTATLYFTQPSSVFTGYTISYGLTQGADSYNVTFSQGSAPGAIKYTVQSLLPNGKYYYKVRANNGCATGPWSTVKTSSGTQPKTLPVTGPKTIIGIGIGGLLILFAGIGMTFGL